MDFPPRLFTVTSEHNPSFTFFSFSVFTLLVVVSVRYRLS